MCGNDLDGRVNGWESCGWPSIARIEHLRFDHELAAYAELAAPAVIANGGRFLVRGGQMIAKEDGVEQRTVVVEFDSFDTAVATYESDGYKAALEKLEEMAAYTQQFEES